MREYDLAALAWGAVLDHRNQHLRAADLVGTAIIANPEISNCPAVKDLIAEGAKSAHSYRAYEPGARINNDGSAVSTPGPWPHAHAIAVGIEAGKYPKNLWICAAEQVTKAERLR